MGILSLFKNLNLGFGMPHMPTTTSASAMDVKEYKEVEHDNKMSLAGDHNEITGVDKDKRFRNDEVSYHDLKRVFIGYPPKSSVPDCPYHLQTGFCTIGMDCKFNHPSREENVEGKLEEADSGPRRLAKFKGDQGLGHILSSENVGQIECKENVEGKLEEADSGLRRLAKFKGDQGIGHITSSENVGQIECKFYLLPGGCKYGNDCGFLHHVELNFMGLPIRLGEKLCPFYMRTGGCKFASRCRFHHPDPTAVVGHSFQDQKNGVPTQDHGPVEQLCETSRPSEKTSNEQTAYLGLFTPNRGLQQNVHWNGDQTTTSQLHPREMNINDQRTTLANKHIAYEFSGGVELQQFEEYPQMPSEPECQYFMKTGYCKFKSACRYHHPKSNASFLGLSERPSSNNHQHRGPVEQLSETPLPSVITSNEQTGFLGPSSSYVPDLFTPNQGFKQNAQWKEHQTVTSLMHPPEIKKIDEQQALANKDAAYEFSGGEPQQFDEYPQRPGKPECQYFMKTGYCKFNSACRYHHPKSTLSSLSLPLRPARSNYEQDGIVEQICEIPLPSENSSNDQSTFLCLSSSNVPDLFTPNQGLQPNVQWNGDQTVTSLMHPPEIKKIDEQQALANKDAAYEYSGGEPQQFDEYPQRPGKPECQYFLKTGYCKFNSACRYHHPKSTLSYLSLPLRPARNNYKQDGLVEQICEIPLPSENSSNDQNTLLCLSSSNVPDLFTPNQGLQPNVQWNGDQTVTSLMHPPEIKKIDEQQALANKDAAYEFSGGEPQQFDEYPQRPGKPECQYFMKTGYCKFNSACRYHHPKSTLSSLSLPPRPARNNFEQDGLVEQICEIPLPSKNSSNDQSTFLCLSSSNVPDLFTPNQGLQPNVQWNGDQTVTSLLYPPEIKKVDQQQALANKDAAYEFSGSEPQQFDEYPQRPGKPECQYFMKTGYCKFNSACRYHHPKSTLSYLSLPLRLARNNYEQNGLVERICEIPLPSENSSNDQSTFLCLSSSNVPDLFTPNQGLQPNVQWDGDQMATDPLHPPEIKLIEKNQELAYNDTAYEFNGGVKSQQFDEYPQRPGEPECQYFMQTGYCKFKSSCIFHHPKSNPSFLSPPLKPEKPICTYYSRHGICKFGSACRYNHHMDHTKHMQH